MGRIARVVRKIGKFLRVKRFFANADSLSEEEEEDETAELLRELEK